MGTTTSKEETVAELKALVVQLDQAGIGTTNKPNSVSAGCAFTSASDYFDHQLQKVVMCLTCANPTAATRIDKGNHIVRMTQHPNILHYVSDTKWNGKKSTMVALPPSTPLIANPSGARPSGSKAHQSAHHGHSFLLLQLHISEILYGFSGIIDAVMMLSQKHQFDSLHPSQIYVVPTPTNTKATAASVVAGRWLLADLSTTSLRTPLADVTTSRSVAMCLLHIIFSAVSSDAQCDQLKGLCKTVTLKEAITQLQAALERSKSYVPKPHEPRSPTPPERTSREHSKEHSPTAGHHTPPPQMAEEITDSSSPSSTTFNSPTAPEAHDRPDVAEFSIDPIVRKRFVRFLRHYNPKKLEKEGFVDEVLTKYRGMEKQLFEALERKYGPEAELPESNNDNDAEDCQHEELAVHQDDTTTAPSGEEEVGSGTKPVTSPQDEDGDHAAQEEPQEDEEQPQEEGKTVDGDGDGAIASSEVVEDNDTSRSEQEATEEQNDDAQAPSVAVEDKANRGSSGDGEQPSMDPAAEPSEVKEGSAEETSTPQPSPPAEPSTTTQAQDDISPRPDDLDIDGELLWWICDVIEGRHRELAELRNLLRNGFDDPLCRILSVATKLHTYTEGVRGDIGAASPTDAGKQRHFSPGSRRYITAEPKTVFDAYDGISANVQRMLTDATSVEVELLKSRVLPWLLQPMHVAQSSSGPLYNTLLDPEGPFIQLAAADRTVGGILQTFAARCFESPDMGVRTGFLRFLPTLLPKFVSTPLLYGHISHSFSYLLFQFRVAVQEKGAKQHQGVPKVDRNWCNCIRWHIRTVRELCVEMINRAAPETAPSGKPAAHLESVASYVNKTLLKELLALVHTLVAEYPNHSIHSTNVDPELVAIQSHLLKCLQAGVTCVATLWDAHPLIHRAPVLETLAHCVYYGAIDTRELSIGLLLGLIGSGTPQISHDDLRDWWLPLFAPLCADREKRIRHGSCDVVIKILSTLQCAPQGVASPPPTPSKGTASPQSFPPAAAQSAPAKKPSLIKLIQPIEDETAAAITKTKDMVAATQPSVRRVELETFIHYHKAAYQTLFEQWDQLDDAVKQALMPLVGQKDFLAQQLKLVQSTTGLLPFVAAAGMAGSQKAAVGAASPTSNQVADGSSVATTPIFHGYSPMPHPDSLLLPQPLY